MVESNPDEGTSSGPERRRSADEAAEALRAAVQRTLAATAGSASETRQRAEGLLNEVARRGELAAEQISRTGEAAREGVVRRGEAAREEVARRREAARDEVARRGEEAGSRLAEALGDLRLVERTDLTELHERLDSLERRIGRLEGEGPRPEEPTNPQLQGEGSPSEPASGADLGA